MDLLNGGPALSPPYRKRLHTAHTATKTLFRHSTDIQRLAAVYLELQEQCSHILKEIATLVVDPGFVTDVDPESDPVNQQALGCFRLLVKLSDAHRGQKSREHTTTTEAGPSDTACQLTSSDTATLGGTTQSPTISPTASDYEMPRPVLSTNSHQDFELGQTMADNVEDAMVRFRNADEVSIAATYDYATLSRKKTKDQTRYDAGTKLQDLRRATHHAALEFGVSLLLAPKVAQLQTLGPCMDMISQVCDRALRVADVCRSDDGPLSALRAAPQALSRCRDYTREFLQVQRSELQKIVEKRLASENSYHDNPDLYVSDQNEPVPKPSTAHGPADTTPDMSGFLHAKKLPGLKAKAWSRWFFAIHDHALLLWHPDVEDWAVFCGLTGAACRDLAISDRSNTFQITFPKLKHLKLKLQGESRKDVSDWMSAISSVSRKLSGTLGVHSAPKDGHTAPVYFSTTVPRRSLTDDRLSGISDTKDGNAMWVPDSAGKLHLVLVNDSDADAEPAHRPDSMHEPEAPLPVFDPHAGEFSTVTDDSSDRKNPFGGCERKNPFGGKNSPVLEMASLDPVQIAASDILFEDDDVDDSLFARKPRPQRPPPPRLSNATNNSPNSEYIECEPR